jgi:endonuclease/exonuclease/phosphatase family metal-dependent hydrolase
MSSQKLRPLLLALPVLLLGWVLLPPDASAGGRSQDYLLCFWNVENLFDDRDDGRKGPGDRTYDPWFANNPRVLEQKLSRLSEALVKLNGGKGPDILAAVEVESVRAAELLRDALNKRLDDESLHYRSVLMKELTAGRHIAPAIITRLPVRGDKTRLHGKRMRILEAHVVVDGKDLVILASHWTARGRKTTVQHRAGYGDQLYGVFKAMYRSNPRVDVLICGDFNDTPQDESVTEHLRATSDLQAVKRSGEEPRLLNLFAGKEADKWGTHYEKGRWFIFDQIVVSPGMLDRAGWSCDPASAAVVNQLIKPRDRLRRPWRFGSPKDKFERGYSDHFPVTVRLQVYGR